MKSRQPSKQHREADRYFAQLRREARRQRRLASLLDGLIETCGIEMIALSELTHRAVRAETVVERGRAETRLGQAALDIGRQALLDIGFFKELRSELVDLQSALKGQKTE